ncbi:putative ribonuclease H protein [Camellia lanceoleosa]|uniref:Ribonuclease H protein n=1 Tax=Camellia lanceoleosa TaxID=1840588 RepID=A0ACC0J1Z0_9ERIC|nr:putative ribonuclease H protein [Camellia lanceoleosa]
MEDTFLPVPPLRTTDQLQLTSTPWKITLRGHLNQAILVENSPLLQHLRVTANFYITQENLVFKHLIQLFPNLHTAEAEVLGSEWISQEEEVLKNEKFALPPLPLFKSPMKALFWNCRGAANPHFRRHFRNLMEAHHPQLPGITETRVGNTRSTNIYKSLGFSNFHITEPISYAGGIWLLWNSLEIHCNVLSVTQQEIHGCIQARILNSKYGGIGRLHCKSSPTWKNLFKGVDFLEKGSKMLLHNGITIRFWTDNWAKCSPLRGCIAGPLSLTDSSLCVGDCWVNNNWDFSRISFVLPPKILTSIKSTSPSWFNYGNDICVWKYSSDDNFCSNSAYLLSKEFRSSPPFSNWSWVWAIPTNPHILYFVWRVLHQKLNTKSHLFHRKIVDDNLCPVCRCVLETIDHVLRECPTVTHYWSCVGIPFDVIPSFSIDLHAWFKLNCQSHISHPSSVHWAILFPFVCWAIWLN